MTKPLRIGLIMQGDRNWIGGVEYIKNIIFALSTLPPEVRATFEICLLCSQSIDSSLYSQVEEYIDRVYQLPNPVESVTIKQFPLNILLFIERLTQRVYNRITRTYNRKFNNLIEQSKIDFVYPYCNQDKSSVCYRSAAWIYDFQHKYLKEFFTPSEIEGRDRSFAIIAECGETVVLSSKMAGEDFKNFFPEAVSKVKVLSFRTYPLPKWYEIDPSEIQHKYYLPERFFLVSNQFWQHKNHLIVFQALKLLQSKSIYPIIVCTGHLHDYRQPEYSNLILQTIHRLNISKQVYLLGLIPRSDQIQLMRRSLAVIQPSLFEGWSTVVEDARCLGKPIILSDFPVHLEQNPPNSVFFNRQSPESLEKLLSDWWEHLLPGPDPEQESIAKTNNIKELEKFGYCFLEIAKGKTL